MEVDGLVKTFGSFTAVNAVSFSVEEGEIFGFLGPNGSGKSTTIRMLCGLLTPTAGRAQVLGLDAYRQAELIRERIGYMPQSFSLYGDMTPEENITFYAGMYRVPPARIRERLAALFERLELGRIGGRLARTLSTGWRQRLALAASIVHQPPLVFLDEPTSGVDPVTRRLFWEVIDDLAHEGSTIFVTTHVMDEAEHCTRLAMMHYGNLIAQGTPEEMRTGHVKSMLEVRATPLYEALEALEALDIVPEAALFGDVLHAQCREDVADPVEAVRAGLAARGIVVEAVEVASPTMEDVFVALTRRYQRPDAGGDG